MKKNFKFDLKKSNKKALCLGIAVTDTYAKSIDKIPKWDTLGTFDEVKYGAGGCAVNTAINLNSLGILFWFLFSFFLATKFFVWRKVAA